MTTIKDVPMLTADEKEIELNTILYTAEWSSGYEWKRLGTYTIEAHRVISINNSSRHFRTRCSKGCETEHQFAKGCSRQQLFADIKNAKKHAVALMKEDATKAIDKIKKMQSTIEYINEQIIDVNLLAKVKEPKMVSVR